MGRASCLALLIVVFRFVVRVLRSIVRCFGAFQCFFGCEVLVDFFWVPVVMDGVVMVLHGGFLLSCKEEGSAGLRGLDGSWMHLEDRPVLRASLLVIALVNLLKKVDSV